MNRTMNPLLPSYEFIPDVEARVFQGSDGQQRLFLYGSHDNYNNETWCSFQYRVYSAPVSDLSNWTDHGVSFASKAGEGYFWNGKDCAGTSWTNKRLYAPDVLLIDGKYWLVSCFEDGGLGMSVSNCPEGPFSPATQIVYDDNREPLPSIDPALYAENDKVYLLWGQSCSFGAEGLVGVELIQDSNEIYSIAKRKTKQYLFGTRKNPDQGFGFYEGVSIRKIKSQYYVLYPSNKGPGIHMMSYATADFPLGPYTFGGNILDNDGCDLTSGNNHGSFCEVNGEWYIFYHRGFGNSNMCRRVCVEKISIDENGKISPVRMTNHGFGGPLCPYERINADRATHVRLPGFAPGCYFIEQNKFLHPLTHITDGNCVEYRDFDFGKESMSLRFIAELRPLGGGEINLVLDEPHQNPISTLHIRPSTENSDVPFSIFESSSLPVIGVHTLYMRFKGIPDTPICELASFYFSRKAD